MAKFVFLVILWFFGPKLFASSTFIGNGGNSADLDLAATLAQIAYVAEDLSSLKDDELCYGDDSLSDQSMRDRLNSLNDEQRKFCVQILKKYSAQIYELASENRIQVKWHDQNIFQKVPDGKRRVDAITDPAKMRITIDENRFLRMDGLRRVALVTHELFHLIKINGQYFDDAGEIGPFSGEEGKRQFLDVLGASLAAYGETLNFPEEVAKLQSISRATANHWIGLGIGQSSLQKIEPLLIDEKRVSQVSFQYHYQPNLLGLRVGLSRYEHTKYSRSGYTTSLDNDSYELGVLYRFFPIERFNSRFGQWFINAGLSLTYGELKYVLNDQYVSENDHSTSYGGLFNVDSIFPLMHGLWIMVSGTARYQPHELKDFSARAC